MSPSDSTPSPDEHQALYLYAIARDEPALPEGPGIEDRPVHRLRHGSFAAVLSVVDRAAWVGAEGADHLESLSWVAPRAYRHEKIVEAVAEAAEPVFPARFGTLFSTPERLRDALDTHQEPLLTYFDAVHGADEWAVKGLVDREKAKEHFVEDVASTSESGRAYLQRQKQRQDADATLDDWLDEVADALLDPLATHARESRVLPVQGNAGREEEVAFNWAFLVPRTQERAFRNEVGRQEQKYADRGLALDLTGPWPPYNFRPSLDMGAQET
jgi:hypothetical protein